jgi:hypothetical protein
MYEFQFSDVINKRANSLLHSCLSIDLAWLIIEVQRSLCILDILLHNF